MGTRESMATPTLKQVIEKHRRKLMSIDGVCGVAAGASAHEPHEPCVIVYADTDQWPAQLPREVDGYPVELQKASGFQAW